MILTQHQIEVLQKVIFMAESVAHLQGKERDILPITEEATVLLTFLKDESLAFNMRK